MAGFEPMVTAERLEKPSASNTSGVPELVAPPILARVLLILLVGAAAVASVATGAGDSARAVAAAGEDLTRLLRAMAALKATMVAAMVGAVSWRLGAAVSARWFLAYAAVCVSMAAGLGMIWTLAQVGAGALLVDGGFLASVVLLWRDPVLAERLRALVAQRRATLARRK